MASKAVVEDEDEGGDDIQQRFPRVLAERIDRLRKFSDAGIVSRKAFMAEAVREKLEREEARVMERSAFRTWIEEAAMEGKSPLKAKKR